MIPWTVGQQFQDPEFPLLSGARIVRIAVHPEMSRAGYGTKAVQLLRRYYQGELASLDEEAEVEDNGKSRQANGHGAGPSSSGKCLNSPSQVFPLTVHVFKVFALSAEQETCYPRSQ